MKQHLDGRDKLRLCWQSFLIPEEGYQIRLPLVSFLIDLTCSLRSVGEFCRQVASISPGKCPQGMSEAYFFEWQRQVLLPGRLAGVDPRALGFSKR